MIDPLAVEEQLLPIFLYHERKAFQADLLRKNTARLLWKLRKFPLLRKKSCGYLKIRVPYIAAIDSDCRRCPWRKNCIDRCPRSVRIRYTSRIAKIRPISRDHWHQEARALARWLNEHNATSSQDGKSYILDLGDWEITNIDNPRESYILPNSKLTFSLSEYGIIASGTNHPHTPKHGGGRLCLGSENVFQELLDNGLLVEYCQQILDGFATYNQHGWYWSPGVLLGISRECESCGREYNRDDEGTDEFCGDCGRSCYDCGYATTDPYYDNDGNVLCEECHGERYAYCEGCREFFPRNQDGSGVYRYRSYCSDCFEEKFTYCDNCDSVTPIDETISTDSSIYCEDCGSELTVQCEDCGETIETKDAILNDNLYYCETCAPDYEKPDTITADMFTQSQESEEN